MFSLFTKQLEAGGHPTHDFILRDYQQVLQAILTLRAYYKTTNYRVSNQHILVKLIAILDSDYPDDTVYIRSALSLLGNINILGLNTEYRPGKLMDDPFVGGLNRCMIYAESGSDSSHTPVTVVYHPFTHVNLPLLDGKQVERGLGIDIGKVQVSTYSVSIQALMLGYKRYKSRANGLNLGIPHYIHSEVLPRMLLSFYQQALWNRLWYPIAGIKVITPPNYHKIKTINMLHSDIPAHNTIKMLRSVNVVSYSDILTWQNRRGYSITQLAKLPQNALVYRPTAAFTWFSEVNNIAGLLLTGGHPIYARSGDYTRELDFLLNITMKGNFITDPIQQSLLYPLISQMTDTRNFVK